MRAPWRLLVLIPVCVLVGCNLAPTYTRPSAETPMAYKELTPADFPSTDGWKTAQPQDDVIRGDWWEMFDDPLLSSLEKQVEVSNQTLALAAANYRVAQALVAEARSQMLPRCPAARCPSS
jgi:outer membrane protein, multidrug efflux system